MTILRARIERPDADLAEAKAELAVRDALRSLAESEEQARRDRLPECRRRIQTQLRACQAALDVCVPLFLELRDTIARENTYLGRQVFNPADFLWHEFLGMGSGNGDVSLWEYRRTLLRSAGWLE